MLNWKPGRDRNRAGQGLLRCRKQLALKKEVRVKMLSDEIDAAIVQAHHLQISNEQFVELVRDRLDYFEEQNHKTYGKNMTLKLQPLRSTNWSASMARPTQSMALALRSPRPLLRILWPQRRWQKTTIRCY